LTGNGSYSGDLKVGVRSALRRCTLAVLSSVRVAAVGIETTLVNDPLESLLRITSVASIVAGITVNDLLRRTVGDRVTSHQVGGLDGFSCREGPARTALFLVLDGSGLTLCDPIDGSRRGIGVDSCGRNRVKSLGGTEAEEFLEFFCGPISELGVTESGSVGILVLLGNLVCGHYEVTESVLTF